ncbi:ABC-2 type transport system ATP-binding protein [Haladaptatus litoreus]|uniref:ABC-2 type transport system ATP-binding protein n=1 Tax=Haladaptatus litoreus TaxID=553468 RepID=A0A1N7BPA4_9EURY|nr:ABC transporter ATP-binding protein [Haladaptatus litoreus]SIR53217.1 ABC-2 type transport system ATP-binding protein [Haladaptatus litoreus]
MTPAIETDALTKRFDDTTVVSDLRLTVPEKSVYGFLGPNGAGKTTTMRMLTTLTRPTSGTARVAGQSIDNRDAVVSRIGFLPEEPPLYDELTAREQLRYVAGLRDVGAEERINTLLDRFDLADDADERVSTYSKGMKQKTALIQAILHEPELVFLDEPTSGLDPRAARTVRELISELTDDGMTVFLSTHILPVVEELADTVGVLHDGNLVAEDSPERLTHRAEQEQSLEDVFLDVTSEEEKAVSQ